ncbi:MAG: hypothetical protein V8R92_00315 [Eubacterium sp.]|uniref:tetratricopeptide repeat protein n=1 Tax=Eubacterium sp. TaxID=142586 RepID=UPI00300EF59B
MKKIKKLSSIVLVKKAEKTNNQGKFVKRGENMGRYNIIYTKERLVQSNCPLMLDRYALTKDEANGRMLAQLKLRNIGEKTVVAAYFTLVGYDIEQNKVEEIEEYQFLDLRIATGVQFGNDKAIYFKNKSIRNIEIVCTKVFFDDGDKWENPNFDAVYHDVFKSKRLDGILSREAIDYIDRKELQKYGNNSFFKCVPLEDEENGIRQCVCGAYLMQNVQRCYICHREKEWFKENLNQDLINEKIKKEKEAERESNKKFINRAKIAGVVVAVIAMVVVTINLVNSRIIIPSKQYKQAIEYINKGKIEKGREILSHIKGYKDSKEIYDGKAYDIYGDKLCGEKKYKEAISIYKTSDKKSKAITDGVNELIAQGDIKGAKDIYKKIDWDGVKDEKEYNDLVDLGINLTNYTGEDIELKIDILELIKDRNENGANLYNETVYAVGTDLLNQKKYFKAMQYFEKCPGYSDTADKLNQIYYECGKNYYDRKQYQKAVEQYQQANGYGNSQDMINKSMYKYVKSKKCKRTETTLSYIKSLKKLNYRDSAQIYKNMTKWKVKIYFNDSRYSEKKQSSVSIGYYDYLYCHVDVSGGETEKSKFKMSYTTQWSGESVSKKDKFSGKASDGSSYYVYWDDLDDVNSTVTVRVYNNDTGELLGSASCKVEGEYSYLY